MKKIVIILAIILSILVINQKEQEGMIRFRLIASSNSEIDQTTKKKILRSIQDELLKKHSSLEEERKYLKSQIPTLKEKIKENTEESFTINYGQNYFPEKTYKETTYPEGEYESLVITLGEGAGENFWCILFPPLCMIEEDQEIEYHSFLKEVLTKFLNA